MCNPIILVGLAVASTVAGIASGNAAASAQANAYQEQAKAERDAFHLRRYDRQREQARALGTAQANFAASGVDSSAGTTQAVYDQQVKEYSYDEFNDRYNVSRSIDALNTSAKTTVKNQGNQNLTSVLKMGQTVAGIGGSSGWFGAGTQPYGATVAGKTAVSNDGRLVGGV